MKAKLITILNQCIYNKSIADFNAIVGLINNINDDDITDINIKHGKTGTYVSMFKGYKLVSISFTDNNVMLFCLPDNVSKTYIIDNDGSPKGQKYNMQYDDIKALLLDK